MSHNPGNLVVCSHCKQPFLPDEEGIGVTGGKWTVQQPHHQYFEADPYEDWLAIYHQSEGRDCWQAFLEKGSEKDD